MQNQNRKKLTLEIRQVESGQTFSGIYLGTTERPWTDKETGEEKTLTTVVFQELDSEDRFGIFRDSGLKLALDSGMVKEGMKIEVAKLDKKELKGGRSVNQYDVWSIG